MTLVVALTGGIGSGKSVVSEYFRKLGAPIIDTDEIARDLVKPGSDNLNKIREEFGNSVFEGDALDRSALRRRIFENPQDSSDREWLEALLHPQIRARVVEETQKCEAPYCIVTIPLLTERHSYPNIDRVLVVDVDEATQIERVTMRDDIDENAVKNMMAAQIQRLARISLADDVIHNDGSLEALEQQVKALHEQYLKA